MPSLPADTNYFFGTACIVLGLIIWWVRGWFRCRRRR